MTDCPTIDHPLLAVHDLEAALTLYRGLGFFIAQPGRHPWGTSTTLALFDRQILEIVSIGDASLLGTHAVHDFSFGRHVEYHLSRAEGVALTALYTNDAEATMAALAARGVKCAGTINFGRDVMRADAQPDRTSTTLKIFPNTAMPRLSVFACQQHRRDLLEFPDRMTHPNTATGIAALSIVALPADIAQVAGWFSALHGQDVTSDADGNKTIHTGRGLWRILTPMAFARTYRLGSDMPDLGDGPRIAGIDIATADMRKAKSVLSGAATPFYDDHLALTLPDMQKLGGIALRFVPA
jgi:catechol 2,3-dioxygenase-like lactoylglutathione lyase family enzyme